MKDNFDRFLKDIGYILYMQEQQERNDNDRNLKSKKQFGEGEGVKRTRFTKIA